MSASRGVQMVVVNDGLKAAPVPTMIQLNLGNFGRVERNCPFGRSRSQELIFIYEEEFRVRIDEASNQPRTCDSINFDVLACDPFHGRLLKNPLPTTANGAGT